MHTVLDLAVRVDVPLRDRAVEQKVAVEVLPNDARENARVEHLQGAEDDVPLLLRLLRRENLKGLEADLAQRWQEALRNPQQKWHQ